MLLYVRDPLDHAVSAYQQQIKRGGFTGSFADSLRGYRYPQRVGRFVASLAARGAEVTVRNYSRHSRALLPTLEQWLGVGPGTLALPPVDTVNRSMTLAELELQRQFNALFGKDARRYVSDPLCNLLPDIRSETPGASEEDLAAFLARMREMVDHPHVRAAVPEDEGYRLPALEQVAPRFAQAPAAFPFAFNAEQLRIVVAAFHAEFTRQVGRAQRGELPPAPRPARAGPKRQRARA